MPLVSVVGTSGVGKSFLVKQLAALDCAPAFFEGEAGVFPDWILASVVSGEDPVRRWQWFMDRYRTNLERARVVSDAGLLCFVDGAVLSAEAILPWEPAAIHDDLQRMIDAMQHCPSDVTIVLTASEAYLRERIAARGRSDEQQEVVVQRALAVQAKLQGLAVGRHNVIVIDRTALDFSRSADLAMVDERIQALL
jgi:deoxyadenosine/deoxycytidine kinase